MQNPSTTECLPAGEVLGPRFPGIRSKVDGSGALAVTEWRPSYKRGTLMQAPLALIGSLSALISWWSDRGLAWLIGGLLLLLIIPFTLVVILPTNKRLESQDLDLSSEEAGCLLRRWGRLHAVRSILSGAAFLVFLFTLIGPH